MESKLQELTQKIYQDGIEKANNEAKALDDLRKELDYRAHVARALHNTLVGMLQNKKEINVLMDNDFQRLMKEIEKIKEWA